MSDSPTAPTSQRSPVLLLALFLAVIGAGLSLYSTLHHLQVHATGHTDAACNINATFSCDEVALSKYSEIAGIPLGVFGLGYFVALIVLLGIGLSGAKSAAEHLHGYAALVLIGVLTSLGLGGISITKLGTYCVVCIGIYLITFAQAALLLSARGSLVPSGISAKSASNGLTSALVAVGVVLVGFNFLKPTHLPEHLDLPQPGAADHPALTAKAETIPVTKSPYAGLGEDYREGGDQAKVTVVEFADFQCPACGQLAKTVAQLHREFGDKVLFVFKNYPLDNSCNASLQHKMHEFSCKAAVLARCAGSFGKFWEMNTRLFASQEEINDASMKTWAQALGLSPEQIDSCLNSKDLMAKVQDDITLGNHLGLDSTPTVFINGRRVVGGHGIEELRTQILDLLN